MLDFLAAFVPAFVLIYTLLFVAGLALVAIAKAALLVGRWLDRWLRSW